MDDTGLSGSDPGSTPRDVLTDLLRDKARELLKEALEAEVAGYVEAFRELRDANGLRLVVRNGYKPEREIQTGLGPVSVTPPRVNDRRTDADGERIRFESMILPRYLRRTRSLDDLIPWLYLKGISTGEMGEALQAIIGKDADGFSPNTVVRLKESWAKEFNAWSSRSLEGKRYVYFWVDGIYANVRLEDERPCFLVIVGATANGMKELVAVQDGYRESEQSWLELLLGLKNRGLTVGPELVIGDGALGLWNAVRKVFPKARWQRCWIHKTANVLNNLPKKLHRAANRALQAIWMAQTKKAALQALETFREVYGAKYPKAVECLLKDREALLAFYDFPAEHWRHIRTTNPIESTFATVRLRTAKTKGSGSRLACLTMVWKLALVAQRKWRTLNGESHLVADVLAGVRFKDGVKETAA